MAYDSRPATYEHIARVQQFLGRCIENLLFRSAHHDESKLVDPERAVFDEYTPKLRDTTYGSDEYKAYLAGMGEGLLHHYAVNRHHPEHWPNGIKGMTLLDILEMLCDWKAATERHADGDLMASIEQNQRRFEYGDELKEILRNSAVELFGS